MAQYLAIKEGAGEAKKTPVGLVLVGSFSETSPSDSNHVAKMTNSGSGWNTYFSYSNGTYTCIKPVCGLVVGWVSHYSKSSYTYGKGELYVNGTRRQSYQVPALASGSTSSKYGVYASFVAGNSFYFKTPSDDGYPKQWGSLYIMDDDEYAAFAALYSTAPAMAGYVKI